MSTATLPAGAGADDAAIGNTAWTNPGNVAAGGDATCTLTAFSTQTHYLAASDFNFSIPTGATINGIKVTWRRKTTDGVIADLSVRLLKGGTVVGDDKEAGAVWSTSYANDVFGANNDLWSESWTPADINASDFGAVLSGFKGFSGTDTAEVDSCEIEVTYTPLPDAPGTMGNPSGAWLWFMRRG